METKKSIWSQDTNTSKYPALQTNIRTDVAIIGGGITGISTGLLLAKSGLKVAVFESNIIGDGSTSDSTGNLYFTTDQLLSPIQSKYSLDEAAEVVNSRLEALEVIESWVKEYNLVCDFKNVAMYLYSNYEQGCEKIDEEFQFGDNTSLPFLKPEEDEVPYPHKRALKMPQQYQINPMKYVQGLANEAKKQDCAIYERTHIDSVENKDNFFLLHSENNRIETEYVVHATHSPKGIKLVQTLLGPYREYGIACRLNKPEMPEGIFWGYYEDEKKISTRAYSKNNNPYLVVVGEPHKTGQSSDNSKHIQNLEDFATKHFDIKGIEYKWGGQHYRPADLLPYIGPEKKDSNEFVATGYSTDGLVYGTLAGMIISDKILGRTNQWTDLYSAYRNQPLKSASKFIKENVNVASEMVKDYTNSIIGEDIELDDIQAGEGKIVKYNGEQLAVYRNKKNELIAVSPICTHMKCIVHWNNAENSWDCPCHGSRFTTDGTVIEGPAYKPLEKVDIER